MTAPNSHTTTIAEARKLLGKEARDYTDDQVQQIVTELTFLADLAIESYKKRNQNEPNPAISSAR